MPSDPGVLLRTIVLFSSCDDDDYREIAALSGYRTIEHGETVFEAGAPSDRLFIIHGGQVAIRKADDEGRLVEIARFMPGDCFGELDMFTGTPRNAYAVADGPVSLLTFPSGEKGFWELTELKAGTRAKLLHSFLVQVSSRIRDVNNLVKTNSQIVQDLKKQVYVDKLTGLFNRTFFDETLETVLSQASGSVGLLLYKPDNFKTINDRHGHDAGDKVLRLIADRLREFVPDSDMLYRYMGNENAVILPTADRQSLLDLAGRIGSLLRSLDLSSVLPGDSIRLSVSFGLALSPMHGTTADELMNSAHPLTLEGRGRGGNLTLFPEDSRETHDS